MGLTAHPHSVLWTATSTWNVAVAATLVLGLALAYVLGHVMRLARSASSSWGTAAPSARVARRVARAADLRKSMLVGRFEVIERKVAGTMRLS